MYARSIVESESVTEDTGRKRACYNEKKDPICIASCDKDVSNKRTFMKQESAEWSKPWSISQA
jgi:hypothetical protein